MEDMFPLSNAKLGEVYQIHSFDPTHLSVSWVTELFELGLFPGVRIQVLQIIPEFGKIVLQIGNAKLGLRTEDCDSIYVRRSYF